MVDFLNHRGNEISDISNQVFRCLARLQSINLISLWTTKKIRKVLDKGRLGKGPFLCLCLMRWMMRNPQKPCPECWAPGSKFAAPSAVSGLTKFPPAQIQIESSNVRAAEQDSPWVRTRLAQHLEAISPNSFLKKSFIAGCSKMPRCKAPEILRNEAYLEVRRNDEG